MQAPRSAIQQYDFQQQIAAVTVAAILRQWASVGNDFDAGWRRIRSTVVSRLQLGRAAAVHAATAYIPTVLAETGQAGHAVGVINPSAFLDSAPNGLPLEATLDAAPVRAKIAVAGGASAYEARQSAGKWLAGVGVTILADTRRNVYQADILQRPRVSGYVRMVSPGACDRCIILAGRRYLWNQGFARHPNCNCIHIPATEDVAGDFRTDPYEYFRSLSESEQDRVFGRAGAQAIRDGADIYQVTNVRMRGLSVSGRDDLVRYGGGTRRTIADIYARDPDRRFVIENLRHHGYITGPQTAGGNIRGNDPVSAILTAGRGQGTYTVGGQQVTTARAARYDAVLSGVRDPLNRATMTAAEKRLYDAHYRWQWANAGYRPNSVGANSADRGLGLRPITASERIQADERLRAEVAKLADPSTPSSVLELARLLGF